MIVDQPRQTAPSKGVTKKRPHTDRWTKEETRQFYELLSKWGQNYSFIEHEMKLLYNSKRTRA